MQKSYYNCFEHCSNIYDKIKWYIIYISKKHILYVEFSLFYDFLICTELNLYIMIHIKYETFKCSKQNFIDNKLTILLILNYTTERKRFENTAFFVK